MRLCSRLKRSVRHRRMRGRASFIGCLSVLASGCGASDNCPSPMLPVGEWRNTYGAWVAFDGQIMKYGRPGVHQEQDAIRLCVEPQLDVGVSAKKQDSSRALYRVHDDGASHRFFPRYVFVATTPEAARRGITVSWCEKLEYMEQGWCMQDTFECSQQACLTSRSTGDGAKEAPRR